MVRSFGPNDAMSGPTRTWRVLNLPLGLREPESALRTRAAEVAGAAVWVFPAASLYESGGADRAWFTTSAVSLVLLALGWSRIRSTEPVRR